MVKTEIVPKTNFADVYELLLAKKQNLGDRLELAKSKAIEEVEKAFADEKERIDKAIDQCVDIVEVEIPDEEIVAETIEQETQI